MPGELARIVAHCLRKDVRDRYQTARDVYNNLRELYRDLEGGSRELHPSSSSQVQCAAATHPASPSGVLPSAPAPRLVPGYAAAARRRGGPRVSSAAGATATLLQSPPADVDGRGSAHPVSAPRWHLLVAAAVVVALAAVIWIGTRSTPSRADGGPRAGRGGLRRRSR